MNSSISTTRSTAGPGFAFEDLVAADLLSQFLLDMPIFGIGVPGIQLLSQVGALDWTIDDLQCFGVDAQGRKHKLALSCKSSLQVNRNGLPVDFVSAVWTMWRNEERFNRETDFMALVTRDSHPGFNALWNDIKTWCDGGDVTLASARIEASASHQRVFDSVRLPGALNGTPPTSAETLALIRRLAVHPVDFQLNPSTSLASARQRCRMALTSESQADADNLWRALVQRAEDARLGNGTINLAELLDEIGSSFALKAHPSIAGAWGRLVALSRDHLQNVEMSLPNGHVVERPEGKEIVSYLTANFGCVVTGDSGVGKSALIRRVLDLDFPEMTQVWLEPSVLAAALSEADRLGIGLDHPLLTILERSPSNNNVLVLDSVERLDGAALPRLAAFLSALGKYASSGTVKWRVVITTQIAGFEDQLRGVAVVSAMPHIRVFGLPDDVTRAALLTVPQLRWVANDADVLPVLANLRTLGWVIAAASSFSNNDSEALASSTAVADRLWARWTGGSVRLQRLIMRLAVRDGSFERSFAISQLDDGDAAAIDELPQDAPLIINSRRRIEFQHDLASDWARYQRLKEMADDINAWSALAPQPLWIAALRLFGQYLLKEADQSRHGWDHAFATVSANGNIAAADLLLDALCLDPKLDTHLAARIELFFAENGKLLLRLLHRFAHLATMPRVDESTLLDPALRIYLDAEMRQPIFGRWVPMVRFFATNLDRVAALGAPIVSKICIFWLDGTPLNVNGEPTPLRNILARLALETARTAQVENDAHFGWAGQGNAEKSIFTAALAGAADLRQEVGAFALEMARRRPPAESVQIRGEKLRAAERALRKAASKNVPRRRAPPPPSISSREDLPPWPLGAEGRLNSSFRDAVLHGQALKQLMQVDPPTASEVLLACIIEDQPTREYGSTRIDRDIGLKYDHESYPTIFWKSPFFYYLQLRPEAALVALKQLLDFVMDRWEETVFKNKSVPLLEVRIGKHQSRAFRGTYQEFGWSQENSTANGNLFCALNALERWLTIKIDEGEDIAPWCQHVLDMQSSTALLGVLVNLGKRHPVLFKGILEPLLEIEDLYWWDKHRVETSRFNFDAMNWIRQGEVIFNMARDWLMAPHRSVLLRSIAIDLVKADSNLAVKVGAAAKRWPIPSNRKDSLDQRLLCADLDVANYREGIDEATGESTVVIAYPLDLQRDVAEYQASTAQELLSITLPYRCEAIIAGESNLSPADADYLASLLPDLGTPLSSETDHRVVLAAAAATLIIKSGTWLKDHPEVLRKTGQVIRAVISGVGKTRADINRVGPVPDTALRFAAIGAVHAAFDTNSPNTWDSELLTILSSGDMAALGALMQEAARKREKLGVNWYSLNLMLVLSAGLDMLAPHFGADINLKSRWDRWLVRFRSQHIFGHSTDHANLDMVSIARRVERLLERRRVRLDSCQAGQIQGSARRFVGLSSHVLNAGFAWLLRNEDTQGVAQLLPEHRNLIAQLWTFEAWRMEGDRDIDETGENSNSEYDSPSELGYAILRLLPNYTIAAPIDEARALWESVLGLGPLGHYAVENFIAGWFLLLFKDPDADRFFSEWQAMLDFAFTANWRAGRYWYRGQTMLVNLLGLNASRELGHATAVRTRIKELRPYYQLWATTYMSQDEDGIAAFGHFLSTEAGQCLRLDGVVWLNDALASTERFYRGNTANMLVEALDAILSHHASELVTQSKSRDAMIGIAALLVRNQVATAMGLQARIAALR